MMLNISIPRRGFLLLAAFKSRHVFFKGRIKRIHTVLGIESSCDDTGAAIVTTTGKILGESCISQLDIHNECGGILPVVAQQLHSLNLEKVVESTIQQSGLTFESIDAIAVTVHPGLIMSLTEGVKFAKHLCSKYNKPLIPIHHMEAHALTARMIEQVKFPFLAFLISGGHCILTLIKSISEFYTLGETLDTSPGEVLDKIARRAKLLSILKFRGLCGGKAIEKAAEEGDPTAIPFHNRVLMHKVNCNLSFNSFRTTASYYIKEQEKILGLEPDEVIPDYADLCASVQWGMTRHLCQRLEMAMIYLNATDLFKENDKFLVISGGVASNNFMKEAFKHVADHYNYKLVVPPSNLCTDNGIMIAWNGIEKLRENYPLVHPHELDSITPLAKFDLGVNISDDVEEKLKTINRGKYLKLGKFINEYMTKIKKKYN